MPLWIEHLLALLLVGACAAVILRQSLRTLNGGKGSKIGSCCAKGCDVARPAAAGQRMVFLPAEFLKHR